METKQPKKIFWEARIVLPFKENHLKQNLLVFEATREQAEHKAVCWAEKYVENNRKAIGECIGYDAVMTGQPRVQLLRTSYTTVI